MYQTIEHRKAIITPRIVISEVVSGPGTATVNLEKNENSCRSGVGTINTVTTNYSPWALDKYIGKTKQIFNFEGSYFVIYSLLIF